MNNTDFLATVQYSVGKPWIWHSRGCHVTQITDSWTLGRCSRCLVSWTMPPTHYITGSLSTGVLPVKGSTEIPVVIKLYNPSFQNVSQ